MEPDTSDETNGQEFPGCYVGPVAIGDACSKGQLRCESAKKSKVNTPSAPDGKINGLVLHQVDTQAQRGAMNLMTYSGNEGLFVICCISKTNGPHSKSEVFFSDHQAGTASVCAWEGCALLGGYEGPIICVCEAADVIEQG